MQKDEELARLQSSLEEMEKVLVTRREQRDSTGTVMITTNGFLDVNQVSKN